MDIVSVHALQAAARARRRELALTQNEVAVRAGVSRKWLSAFECGTASAAELPMVLRLLAAIGLRLDVHPLTAPPATREDDHLVEGDHDPTPAPVDLDALLNELTTATPRPPR